MDIAILSVRSLLLFARPRKIFLVTSKVNFPFFSEMFDQGEPVILMDEDRLLKDVDSPSIRQYFFGRDANPGRAGWYFQQFLKMAM